MTVISATPHYREMRRLAVRFECKVKDRRLEVLWNSFKTRSNSGEKEETKAIVFYKWRLKKVSDRLVAPCFVKWAGSLMMVKFNLGVEENMNLNEYAVIVCRTLKFKRGNKVVMKRTHCALKGENYFVKFNINLKEDGKSSRKKKRAMENLNFFNQDIGTSSSAGGHLTQEEAAKEAISKPKIRRMKFGKSKERVDEKYCKRRKREASKKSKGESVKEKHYHWSIKIPHKTGGTARERTISRMRIEESTMNKSHSRQKA
ncbi:hypothetical protein Tco_1300439 [Tanacetum coccineum]